MKKFDLKKIEERLREEFPRSCSIKERAISISNYPPALHEVIEHWINGEYLDFEFKGVSLKEIVERTGAAFPDALTDMHWLLKHPEKAEWFSKTMEDSYTHDVIVFGKKYIPPKRREYKWLTK